MVWRAADKSDSSSVNQQVFVPLKINIEIKDKHYDKILETRQKAFEQGFLITEEENWVKGELVQEDGTRLKIKLRLKGDLLDHLEGDKWSFRVKVRDGESWNGMRTFSLQNPKVREFLNEWLYHKFLEQEDVLCPRYDFIELSINGESKGIYAYEEHFDKQLVESRSRREGPLVKFTEDGLWAGKERSMQISGEMKYNGPLTDFYESSSVKPFKESSTMRDSTLYQQFLVANRLMTQYKYGVKAVPEVFDVDKLARFYAVNDVCEAFHGLFWNNQRFYYNPVIQKLEPIGYDGFSYAPNWTGKAFYGSGMYNKRKQYKDGVDVFYTELFMDSTFMLHYDQQICRISKPAYVDAFMDSMRSEIEAREAYLKTEFTDYIFNWNKFPSHARHVYSLIFPFDDVSLRAYVTDVENKINVINHHKLPITVLGIGDSLSAIRRFETPLTLQVQMDFELPFEYTTLSIAEPADSIYFTLLGIDTIFSSAISTIPHGVNNTPQQDALHEYSILKQQVRGIGVQGSKITMGGDVKISKLVVIPSGYEVMIAEGTKIDFTQGAGLISYSPVMAIGSEENPIMITSSDSSAIGFTVLQAEGYSQLKYTNFFNFNTLSFRKWQLTGAVTFYESDVLMDHCVLTNNHCEDMLNIVRSRLELRNLTIANTFSDGLDVDFGTGKIENARFYHTGNDAMDFSGSTIKATHIMAKDIGDKGISAGEQSTIYTNNVHIENANIGMASKDLSELHSQKVVLKNCKTGFSVFEKKTEFGPAKMVISKLTQESVDTLHNVQHLSILKIEGEKVK